MRAKPLLFLFYGMIGALNAASPQVVLEPSQFGNTGILVRLAGTNEFLNSATEHVGSALASTANSSQLAVLLENHSNRAVAAFAILYRVKWNDGRDTMESMRISNFDPYQWKQRIMPG